MIVLASTNVLLHICCGPCSVACVQALRQEDAAVTGFWYNPNIHPYTEYQSRREALASYADQIALPMVWAGDYGLRSFVQAATEDFQRRCQTCYRLRMEATARHAAENGFAAFSTTLLISPYQDHELLRRVAEASAAKAGVSFLYRDFRPLFRQGQQQARALSLYMQKYCGCVFSEEERYRPQLRGGAP